MCSIAKKWQKWWYWWSTILNDYFTGYDGGGRRRRKKKERRNNKKHKNIKRYIYKKSKSTRTKGRLTSDDPFPRRSSTTSNWSSDPDSVWEEGSGREDRFTARTVPFCKTFFYGLYHSRYTMTLSVRLSWGNHEEHMECYRNSIGVWQIVYLIFRKQ